MGTSDQRGLTFREILALILIISAVVAGLYPVVHVRLDDYRLAKAQEELDELSSALERYKLDNHFYPTTDQGLVALVIMPTTDPVPRNWNQRGYLADGRVPRDPWGNAYVYSSRDEARYYELKSLGSDGQPGGEDMAADIPAFADIE